MTGIKGSRSLVPRWMIDGWADGKQRPVDEASGESFIEGAVGKSEKEREKKRQRQDRREGGGAEKVLAALQRNMGGRERKWVKDPGYMHLTCAGG